MYLRRSISSHFAKCPSQFSGCRGVNQPSRRCITTYGGLPTDGAPGMSRMLDLVLVRHGESEGNVARQKSLRGDHSLYSGEFMKRHSSLWRLTDKGREQAHSAGEWITNNIRAGIDRCGFDRYYTSEYLRAMESAALLKLPGAKWFTELFLHERDWGSFDLMSQEERMSKFGDELRRRERDRFFWVPPGGESLSNVCLRVDRIINMLHRECANKRVLVLCHGEVMWAFRARLERMSQTRFRQMEDARLVKDYIHNCQILHYTRVHPATGELAPSFGWMRSTCPWDESRSRNEWEDIDRPVYTNETLLKEAERYPRLIGDDANQILSRLNLPPPSESPRQVSADSGSTSAATSSPQAVAPDVQKLFSSASAEEGCTMNEAAREGASGEESSAGENRGRPNNTGKDEQYLRPTFERCYIVSKTTRFDQHLRQMDLKDKSIKAIEEAFKNLGLPFESYYKAHEAHEQSVQRIVEGVVKVTGKAPHVLKIDKVNSDVLQSASIVISAGGDGTFLKTASCLRHAGTKNPPILGVNTDPYRSRGALTACEQYATTQFAPVVQDIIDGRYDILVRSRLQVTCIGSHGEEASSDRYCLNEAFFAEREPTSAATYELSINNEQPEKQRSSGVIICTGTGSTAWMANAVFVPEETVQRILVAANARFSGEELQRITQVVNEHHVFSASSEYLQYFVREAVPRRPGESQQHRHGYARRVELRSASNTLRLTLDGLNSIPMPYGSKVILKSVPGLACVELPGHMLR